ncbi:MAG: YbjQ family protein [Pyrinomonadaceae bacterium]
MNNDPSAPRAPYNVTAPRYSVSHHMVTTAFELPNFRVTQNLGIVRGIVVRSRNVVANLGAALQTLVGGNITVWTRLCEQTRAEAFDLMIQHATELGANAIVGARYDATEVMQGATEVLAYGTAVIVEPTDANNSYRS